MSMSEKAFEKLVELVEQELKWSEHVAKKAAKRLNIDYEKNAGDLVLAGRIGLDKLYRLTMDHRDLFHTTSYSEKQIGEIVGITVREYLLSKHLLSDLKEQETLKGMLKYKDAFEDELKNYELIKKDNKVLVITMKPHTGSMDER